MVTRKQLAEMLRQVNAQQVADAADVSLKTIYRLRHEKNAPNMATVQKLLDAIKATQKPARKPGKVAA